jgi:hypothetical protein
MTKDQEIADLKKRLEALEAALNPKVSPSAPRPFERINPLDRLSMPPSALEELVKNVPSDVTRDLVNDQRRSIPQSTSLAEPKRGSGWAEPLELKPPPGINVIDAMCLAEDIKERKRRLREEE